MRNEKRLPDATTKHIDRINIVRSHQAMSFFPNISSRRYPIENITEGTQTKPITARKNIESGSKIKSCAGKKIYHLLLTTL